MTFDGSGKTRQYLFFVALGVIAEVAGTVATFMPMKSVFILGAADVPRFFPGFLVDAGPAVTSIVLLLLAAFLAIVSAIAKQAITVIAKQHAQSNGSQFRRAAVVPDKPSHMEYEETTSLVLIVFFFLTSAVLSPLFTLLILGWVTLVLGALSIRVHRSARRPPFATGVAEFSARFGQWLTASALWSTVVGAIVTLLVSPPALGLTGILLSAVFLARFQQTTAKLAPLIYDRRGRSTHASDPVLARAPSRAVTSPAEFFATLAGRHLLGQLFDRLHLNPSNWSVVGQPSPTQLSLIAHDASDGSERVVRVFAHGRDDLRDGELRLRRRADRAFLRGGWEATPEKMWGIPLIVLSGQAVNEATGFTLATKHDTFTTQAQWEVDCLMGQGKPGDETSSVAHALAHDIRAGIHVVSQLPGPHQESAQFLNSEMERLLQTLVGSPLVLTAGGPLSSLNLLQHQPGEFTILDLSGWQYLPFGWAWPEGDEFYRIVRMQAKESGQPVEFLRAGHTVSLLAALSRVLFAKNLPRIIHLARQLLD